MVSGEGQVNVNMQASGKWVYQFSSQMQQQIKQALLKHSKADAQTILQVYTGVRSSNISISSGSVLPANTSDITLNFVPVPGLVTGHARCHRHAVCASEWYPGWWHARR